MNKAVVFTGSTETGKLTEVKEVPIPTIKENQILIKAIAFAANPTDWKHIVVGWGAKGDIVGTDVSGIVEKVGSKVDSFAVGDYVCSMLHGGYSKEVGGFTNYVVSTPNTTIKLDKASINPAALSKGEHPIDKVHTFEGAASVALGLVTVGLSYSYSLKIKQDKAANSNKTILIWGGTTATGYIAIQVAKLFYGLKVVTTAAPKYEKFLKEAGADFVFDYKLENVSELIATQAGPIDYGLDTVSYPETFQAVYDATAGSSSAAIDAILNIDPSALKLDPARKVLITTTLSYFAEGTDIRFHNYTLPLPENLISEYYTFWSKIPELFPKIKHLKLKVLDEGFSSANEALELLRENKVHFEKVVFRA